MLSSSHGPAACARAELPPVTAGRSGNGKKCCISSFQSWPQLYLPSLFHSQINKPRSSAWTHSTLTPGAPKNSVSLTLLRCLGLVLSLHTVLLKWLQAYMAISGIHTAQNMLTNWKGFRAELKEGFRVRKRCPKARARSNLVYLFSQRESSGWLDYSS